MHDPIHAHPHKKLGKRAPKHIRHMPYLASVIAAQPLPPPPASQDWYSKVPQPWGVMLNNEIGDCGFAAIFHMRMQWTYYASGSASVVPDALVQKAYSAVTGYDPSQTNPTTGYNPTDQGVALTDALTWWLRLGFDAGAAGLEQITAFCAVHPQNHDEVKYGIAWMGNLYIGIDMPLAWQADGPWDVQPPKTLGSRRKWVPGSWGGHCTPVVGFSPEGVWVITWGQPQFMTWAAWDMYVDEAYCVLNVDWTKPPGVAPSGLDWAGLMEKMDLLREGLPLPAEPAA